MSVIRKKQCRNCPWKKSARVEDIPGYSAELHEELRACSAPQDLWRQVATVATDGGLQMMACHDSEEGDEYPCVGWVCNQLGPGNNLALRISALDGRYDGLETEGEQYDTIEETIRRP